MARRRILYTAQAVTSLRHLPPLAKPAIKKLIEQLAEAPQSGKPLRHELAGFFSARHQRWRVIYRLDDARRAVVVYLIEHRQTVYETLRTFLE